MYGEKILHIQSDTLGDFFQGYAFNWESEMDPSFLFPSYCYWVGVSYVAILSKLVSSLKSMETAEISLI